ncbi:MAG: hypothetical protein QN162_04685 [Armatimonadota bacterium]|nr:hypothetical protein [Armatimonadota bacterium]
MPRARPVESVLWWMAAIPATAVIVVGFGVPLLQSLAASFVRDGRMTLANYGWCTGCTGRTSSTRCWWPSPVSP